MLLIMLIMARPLLGLGLCRLLPWWTALPVNVIMLAISI